MANKVWRGAVEEGAVEEGAGRKGWQTRFGEWVLRKGLEGKGGKQGLVRGFSLFRNPFGSQKEMGKQSFKSFRLKGRRRHGWRIILGEEPRPGLYARL